MANGIFSKKVENHIVISEEEAHILKQGLAAVILCGHVFNENTAKGLENLLSTGDRNKGTWDCKPEA